MAGTNRTRRAYAANIATAVNEFLLSQNHIRDPQVMKYVSSFMRNLGSLLVAVRTSGLEISGFKSDSALEFYFDVSRSGKAAAFVSKGWDEPGSRVGELIWIRKRHAAVFHKNFWKISNAMGGMAISFFCKKAKDGGLVIELWTPLFGEVLSPRCLVDAIDTLLECERTVQKFCFFDRLPPGNPDAFLEN